jgi:hypothetical protein
MRIRPASWLGRAIAGHRFSRVNVVSTCWLIVDIRKTYEVDLLVLNLVNPHMRKAFSFNKTLGNGGIEGGLRNHRANQMFGDSSGQHLVRHDAQVLLRVPNWIRIRTNIDGFTVQDGEVAKS